MFYRPNILYCRQLSQPIVHFLPILPTSWEHYSTTSARFSLCKQVTHQRKPKPSATGLNLQPVLFPTVPTGASSNRQAGLLADSLTLTYDMLVDSCLCITYALLCSLLSCSPLSKVHHSQGTVQVLVHLWTLALLVHTNLPFSIECI